MNLNNVLEKGYFPKELPATFYTSKLDNNIDDVKARWLAYETAETNKFLGESNTDWNRRKKKFNNNLNSKKHL